MELKFEKIKATTEFETITEFKLLNYDELPFKFISQTNLYKGDEYYRPNTEGAPIYITNTSEIGIYNINRGEDEIRPCVCLAFHDWRDTADYDEDPWYEDYINYMEIKFDPFTGEEIKISIVSEKDVTDQLIDLDKEYKKLSKELKKINYNKINEIHTKMHEIELEKTKLFKNL